MWVIPMDGTDEHGGTIMNRLFALPALLACGILASTVVTDGPSASAAAVASAPAPDRRAPQTTGPGVPDPCGPYVRPIPGDVVARRTTSGCWSLIASGDSVTSAHEQWQSGLSTATNPCPNTSFGRAGVGNSESFSYAWQVFHQARKFGFGNHYNFARTGYTTTNMRTAGPGTRDACANAWGQALPPIGKVLQATEFEKSEGRKVAWVTTGGVNNTNWSLVLAEFVKCSMAQRAWSVSLGMTITPTGLAPHKLDGSAHDMAALDLLLSRGGSCTFSFPKLGATTVVVPAFNLRTVGATITSDVSAMVSTAVAAKIDQIVWVGYYDVSPAVIDMVGLVREIGASKGWNPTLVELAINTFRGAGVPTAFPISRSATQTATLRRNLTDLNTAICAGVQSGSANAAAGSVTCTTWPMPAFKVPGDIQSTVKGGMPHPSRAGHGKLANMLIPIFGGR